MKLAFDVALPSLLSSCETAASSAPGQEAVFLVLAAADEWLSDPWPALFSKYNTMQQSTEHLPFKDSNCAANTDESVILGRRLIYSHHIISNQKRKDIQDLAKHYNLSGFVKIGWPGLIVLEGLDEDCNHFYDTIRRWAWQYLVVRGEMQETCDSFELMEQSHRRFHHGFKEVDDMSIVANACREAGLEKLFKTSMKIYDNDEEEDPEKSTSTKSELHQEFGALMFVDHMNNGKGYRKWLRKNAAELGLQLWIRHFLRASSEPVGANNKDIRGPFLVIIVGLDKATVGTFLKRWRSTRVDVDAKGKPCLERKMNVLVESYTARSGKTTVPIDDEESMVFSQSRSELVNLVHSIGADEWASVLENSF